MDSIIVRPASGGNLQLLHYSSPFIIIAGAIVLSTTSACFIRPSKRTILKPSLRSISANASLAITLLYVFEGLLCALRTIIQADWVLEDDRVVYVALCFLIWLIIYLIHTDAESVYRLTNIPTFALASSLETAICVLSSRTWTSEPFDYAQSSVYIIRPACIASLCLCNAFPGQFLSRKGFKKEPLSQTHAETTCISEAEHNPLPSIDNAVPNNNEDGIANRSRQAHLQRLEDAEGWWQYLRNLSFVLPTIVPTEDPRHQFYALCMFMLMLCSRASNLVGPQLLGTIAEEISHMRGNQAWPWRSILTFILITKTPHDLILAPIRRCLNVRFSFWSWRKLQLTAFSHITGLSFEFHENQRTEEIQASLDQAVSLSRFADELIDNILPLLIDVLVAFWYLTYVFDVYLSLILTGTYVFYGIVVYKGTVWVARQRRQLQASHRIEKHILHEAIANWMSAFYFNRQSHQQRHLEEATQREVDETTYFYDVTEVTHIFRNLVSILGYFAAFSRASYLATTRDEAVGGFVTFLFYWPVFTTPIFRIAAACRDFAMLFIDLEPLIEIAQTRQTVTDAEGARDLNFQNGKVEYRNVNFSYDGRNQVLQNLSFTVLPGSTVAFVGKTGSGKTTTCDKLLFRAYDVTGGAILIDGQDIRDVTQHSLREMCGIVRQEQCFYNDTILEIVRFARLDATMEEVHEACRSAAVHDQIMSFPQGYNSKIGERGVKLSAGQRQRLAIAQVFLRNPKIIVLDEATSAVDNITESEIQESFAKICQGRTTFIVAHRLSTVQHADQIFVLDKGMIVESGTHDQLLALQGQYYRLWHRKSTVDRLEDALKRYKSTTDQTASDEALISLSEIHDDDSDSIGDIFQVDGAGSSKQGDSSDNAGTGVRKRIQRLKKKFGAKQQDNEEDYESNDEDDTTPIRVISPRATDSSISEATPQRYSSRGTASQDAKTTPFEASITPNRVAFSKIATPSSKTPPSSVMPPRQESTIDARSPGLRPSNYSTALTSHPISKDDDAFDRPSAYQMPDASMDVTQTYEQSD